MVTLIILDGFGESKQTQGNAIKAAGTPNLDKLKKSYPFTLLKASGEAVGFPKGQMGNSEVGHLTIGAGRKILQDLENINYCIKTRDFFKNEALVRALDFAEQNHSSLHIMGLLSNGGVHSHINHLYAILDAAKSRKIPAIYLHAFTDGRDTGIYEGINFCNDVISHTKDMSNFKIASIGGRVYGMDREQRYDRLEKAYKAIVLAEGENFNSAQEALQTSYSRGVSDEYVIPCVINGGAEIKDGDSVIFYNFRSDRARELTFAITDPKFSHFKTKHFKNLLFSPMQQYAEELSHLNTFYKPKIVEDNLAAVISAAGKKQFHISETTKYAHVTFFINGGIEKPYPGEERKLIETIDAQDFAAYPQMRAYEITEATLEAISNLKYDFIVVNFSNADMVGHTGNFEAAKKAITAVDKFAYAVALATLMAGGEAIITADHGNAELMYNEKGEKVTSHTTNLVPLYFVSEKHKDVKLAKGRSLTAIAPTILKLLSITPPANMDKPLF